jgi:hypothetical protein
MSYRVLLAAVTAVVVALSASAQNQKLEIVKLADGVTRASIPNSGWIRSKAIR